MQLPFLAWLIVLWMLLWAQFTVLSFLTGLVVAIFVTRVFRLPTVELSGRINLWYGALFVVQFLFAILRGALSVTVQVFDFRRQPGTAIIAVPLRYADDLVMTHVAVVSSLIPGSLVVEADRDRGILYLHVIGVRSREDVEKQRQGVLGWEKRIVRALGNPTQPTNVPAASTPRRSAVPDEHPAPHHPRRVRRGRDPRRHPHRARSVDPRPCRRRRRAADRGHVRARRRDGHQRPHPQHPRAPHHRGGRCVRIDRGRPVRREKGQHDTMNVFGLMIPDAVVDVAVLVLILLGAILCLSASVGLLHFRDVPTRLHAATKPQVLGLLLICVAIALSQRSVGGVLFGLVLVAPVVLMQFATAPLSAHMVGRQAYRNGTIEHRGLVVDELAESKQTPPAAG
ncbi:unnamed protein product [Penicillium discolor]